MSLTTENAAKTYVLVSAMPTPNGRLHLGHIGGPFLSQDILARHLRMSGHKAVIVSGTDSYDSYVTWQAERENLTPLQICNKYHEQIAGDLSAMQISVNKFINPLTLQWAGKYKKWHHQLLKQLQDAGVTQSQKETIGVDANGNLISGWRLAGNCPVCHAAVRGYFCEDCGAHFRPEEVANAEEPAAKTTVANLFMHLPQNSDLENRGIDESIKQIYKNYITLQKGLLRLTSSSEWGLSIGNPQLGDKFFNYPFAFAFALMLGEVAGDILGLKKNPFAPDSEVTTISAFGIDNTIPVLGSILGITDGCKQYKQFDYYLVNHFLNLNGSKFSTSRRHAIWANDIINKVGASSDIVRLYLSTIDIRTQAGNVDTTELTNFYNKTTQWIEKLVVQALPALPENNNHADPAIAEYFSAVVEGQSKLLDPANFQPHDASSAIASWVNLGHSLSPVSASYFWWLKGLAVLTYPFMPRLAETLWVTLGYTDVPRFSQFEVPPTLPVKRYMPINLKQINQADIESGIGVPAT